MKRVGQVSLMVAIVGIASSGVAFSQGAYPSRQISFLTSSTPGGTSDIMARSIADDLRARLGKPVVVENKTGGAGLVAAGATVAAPADGYTMLLSSQGTLVITPLVTSSMQFDAAVALRPVALVARGTGVLVVNPKVTPVASVAELIALARSKPQKVTYGVVGAGSEASIAAVMLARQAGIEMTPVSYKGFAPAVSAVAAGEIAMMMPDMGLVKGRIADGSLRALAVSTAERSPQLPDVPALRELGYNIDIALWHGVFVRSETPAAIAQRLAEDIRAIVRTPAIRQRWETLGLDAGDKFGGDFERYYQAEIKRWSELLRPLDIKVE